MLTDADKRYINELIATKLDIMSAFRDLPEADRESIARDIESFLYSRQPALRKPENFYTPRWTQDMADINADDGGIERGHAGPTLPRWVDQVGGSSWLDADDPQILHIRSAGGGADCMFDLLVSTCFATLAGFSEGMTFTSLSGCTFKGYSTFQGALTKARTDAADRVIFVCGGTYNENVSVGNNLHTVRIFGAGTTRTVVNGNNTDTYTFNCAATTLGVSISDMTFGYNVTQPTTAIFGNANSVPLELRNVTLRPGASENGAQFNGQERIYNLQIIGPTSGTQAAFGFTMANTDLPMQMTDLYISGCAAGIQGTNSGRKSIAHAFITGAGSVGLFGASSGAGDSFHECTFTDFTIVDSAKAVSYGNNGGHSTIYKGFVIDNCAIAVDVRGSASSIFSCVFDDWTLTLGTAGDIGVDFTNASNGHAIYNQFTNFNFKGYTCGNEFKNASGTHIGTGTVGYHNVSDAGLTCTPDFGSPTGHSTIAGGVEHHTLMAIVDNTIVSTTVPYAIVGPVASAATITAVEAVCGDNVTCGATSAIFDVHKILAANENTDGAGTTLFTTQANRPTISNGNKKSTTTLPDVLTLAAGDLLAFYSDQQGTNLTVATVAVRATFP